jgi:predicted metal-dependent HD superfamily phosphohydrolase
MSTEIEILKQFWDELTRDFPASELLFEEILTGYTSPKRVYHNSTHIYNLLKLSEEYKQKLHRISVCRFSIFYHDIIYDPVSKTNEEDSAEFAKRSLSRMKVNSEIIEAVSGYILATANHFSYLGTDADLQYFLDFDLAILSSPKKVYLEYACNIRQEYGMVTDTQFNLGRIGFLDKILSRPTIYFTSDFRSREQVARKNLLWEREYLSSLKNK